MVKNTKKTKVECIKISTVMSPIPIQKIQQNSSGSAQRRNSIFGFKNSKAHTRMSVTLSPIQVKLSETVIDENDSPSHCSNSDPNPAAGNTSLHSNASNSTCGDIKKSTIRKKKNVKSKANIFIEEKIDPLLTERSSVSPEIILVSYDSSSRSADLKGNNKKDITKGTKETDNTPDEYSQSLTSLLSNDFAESNSKETNLERINSCDPIHPSNDDNDDHTVEVSVSSNSISCFAKDRDALHKIEEMLRSSPVSLVDASSSSVNVSSVTQQASPVNGTQQIDTTLNDSAAPKYLFPVSQDMFASTDDSQDIVIVSDFVKPFKKEEVKNVLQQPVNIPASKATIKKSNVSQELKLIAQQQKILNLHEVDLDYDDTSGEEPNSNQNIENSDCMLAKPFGDDIIDQEVLSALQECFAMEKEEHEVDMIPDTQPDGSNQSSNQVSLFVETILNAQGQKLQRMGHSPLPSSKPFTCGSISPVQSNFSKESTLTTPFQSQNKSFKSPSSMCKRVIFQLDKDLHKSEDSSSVHEDTDTTETTSKDELITEQTSESNTGISASERATMTTTTSSRTRSTKGSSKPSSTRSKSLSSEPSKSRDSSGSRTLRSSGSSSRDKSTSFDTSTTSGPGKSNYDESVTNRSENDTSTDLESTKSFSTDPEDKPVVKISPLTGKGKIKKRPQLSSPKQNVQSEKIKIDSALCGGASAEKRSKKDEGKRLWNLDISACNISQESELSSEASDSNKPAEISLDYIKSLPGRTSALSKPDLTKSETSKKESIKQASKPKPTEKPLALGDDTLSIECDDIFATPMDLTDLPKECFDSCNNEPAVVKDKIDELLDTDENIQSDIEELNVVLENQEEKIAAEEIMKLKELENINKEKEKFFEPLFPIIEENIETADQSEDQDSNGNFQSHIISQTNKANQESGNFHEWTMFGKPNPIKKMNDPSPDKCPDLISRVRLIEKSNHGTEMRFGAILKKPIKKTGDVGSDDRAPTRLANKSNFFTEELKGDKLNCESGKKRLIDPEFIFIASQESQVSSMENSPVVRPFTKSDLKNLPGRSNSGCPSKNQGETLTAKAVPSKQKSAGLMSNPDVPANDVEIRRSSRLQSAGQQSAQVIESFRKKSTPKKIDTSQQKRKRSKMESPGNNNISDKEDLNFSMIKTNNARVPNNESRTSPESAAQKDSQKKKFFSTSFADRHKNSTYTSKGWMKLPFDDRRSDSDLFGTNKKTFYKSKSLQTMVANKSKEAEKKIDKGDDCKAVDASCKRGVKRGLSVKKTDNIVNPQKSVSSVPASNTKLAKQKKQQSNSPFTVWHDSDDDANHVIIDDYDEVKKKEKLQSDRKNIDSNKEDPKIAEPPSVSCDRSNSLNNFSSSSSCNCSSCKKCISADVKIKSFTSTPNVSSDTSTNISPRKNLNCENLEIIQDTINTAKTLKKNTSDCVQNFKKQLCQNERKVVCQCLQKSAKSLIHLSEMLQEMGSQFGKLSETISNPTNSKPEE